MKSMPSKKASKKDAKALDVFEAKYGAGIKAAYEYFKRHFGSHLQEHWNAVVEELKALETAFPNSGIAILKELEAINNTGAAEYLHLINNGENPGSFVEAAYRSGFLGVYAHAKAMYIAHVKGDEMPDYDASCNLYDGLVLAFVQWLEKDMEVLKNAG